MTPPVARPDVERLQGLCDIARTGFAPGHYWDLIHDVLTYLLAVEGELATVKRDYETMARMAGVQPASLTPTHKETDHAED
jgi:hypothetical protein